MIIADLLKFVVVCGCLVAFIFNSYQIFEQFAKQRTTLVTAVETEEELSLPALTFCNADGYRSKTRFFSNLTEYIRATFTKEELFEAYGQPYGKIKNNYRVHDEMQTLYSFLRGRCYTYTYPSKLRPTDTLVFNPRNNVSLLIFAHEPGEEFLFSVNYMAEAIPVTTFEMDTMLMDFQIVKEKYLEEDSDNCRDDWNMSNYITCVKNNFGELYGEQLRLKILPNCTLPWVQSMLSLLTYTDLPCSYGDREKQADWIEEFLQNATTFKNKNCQRACNRTRYKIRAEKYSFRSMSLLKEETATKERVVYIYYSSSDVTTFINEKIMSFNTFISTVGGNLGLFLGFSCSSVLFAVIDRVVAFAYKQKF